MKLGYTRIQWDNLEYVGFEFYDAIVEIDAYFMRFIPIYRPIPFFQSRLPLCNFDVAQFRMYFWAQRQKILGISGISRLLIHRLFFMDSQLSSQMKQILHP
jgi:hypothetical protein